MSRLDVTLRPLSAARGWPARVRVQWDGDAGTLVMDHAPAQMELAVAADIAGMQGWVTVAGARVEMPAQPLRDARAAALLLARYFVVSAELQALLPADMIAGDDLL